MFIKLLAVGVGGFTGAIARYAVSGLTHRILDGRFPYGTLAVNIIGCFLIGLLGSFTTYSTFAYESVEMLLDQMYLAAIANVLTHLIVGIVVVWAATLLGQVITR